MNKTPKQILRELVEEVLDEMSTSAAAGPYMTPNAFRGNKSKKAETEKSMPGGKVVGKEDTDDTTINEARTRFRNFKESDEMRNHSKVSYGIKEAKKILREVEFLVSICERLKTECGVPSDKLWKRTQPDLVDINNRLKEIAKRIKRIGK